MSEIKFTEEELKSLKDLQEGYLRVQAKFGQIAIAKLTLQRQAEELGKTEENVRTEFTELQKKEQEMVNEFTETYGKGSLDPESGVFTPEPSEEKNN